MKLYSHPLYPIGKPDTTITPPGAITYKTIKDYPTELQNTWNSLTGYIKPQQLQTTAPQSNMRKGG